MFIHLGNEVVILREHLIMIINLERNISQEIKDIIKLAEDKGQLHRIGSRGKEKAVVICINQVYISPITSRTLHKRAHYQLGRSED